VGRIVIVLLVVVSAGAVILVASQNGGDSNPTVSTPPPGAISTDTNAEKAMLNGAVANWKGRHRSGICTISYPTRASCQTVNGLRTDLQVSVVNGVTAVTTTQSIRRLPS
jgi:hypothetical protein